MSDESHGGIGGGSHGAVSRASRRPAVGRALLGAAAALLLLSGLLPPGHPETHYRGLAGNVTLLREYSVYAAEGNWGPLLQPAAFTLAYASPLLLAIALVPGAALGRGRLAALLSGLLETIFLVAVASALWLLFVDVMTAGAANRSVAMAYGGGAVLVTAIAAVELRVWRAALKSSTSAGDALHIAPLVLYAIAGFATGWVFRNDESWHSVDYFTVGAACVLGLAALVVRRAPRAS